MAVAQGCSSNTTHIHIITIVFEMISFFSALIVVFSIPFCIFFKIFIS
jgi:hypothetical protein